METLGPVIYLFNNSCASMKFKAVGEGAHTNPKSPILGVLISAEK